MSDCLLCRLARREADVSVVYEDEQTVTFMDIQPVVRGHMLVVPRAHAAYLADLNPEDGAQLFRVGQLAAAALRSSTLLCEGVTFFLADGEAAGQEIFHVHLHVFPRFAGDGFGLRFPPDYSVRPRAELDEAADALRQVWPPIWLLTPKSSLGEKHPHRLHTGFVSCKRASHESWRDRCGRFG